MKEKIIEILKEYFVEGYEYPPDSGRKEHRISMAVIDADDADVIASRIEALQSQPITDHELSELTAEWIRDTPHINVGIGSAFASGYRMAESRTT